MHQAAEELRSLMMEENNSLKADDNIEVCVSFDGTWSKRGFTANHGIGVVISMDTGKVLDRITLSKLCGPCSKQDQADENFEAWYDNHKPVCQKNYTGSSPGMETYAAHVMWNR